jgi:hypothetical protein
MAAATVVAALSLVTVKLAHRIILQGQGVRSASYVAAIGEMIATKLIPTRIPRQWARDHLFHEAIIDYRRLLSGDEGEFVEELIRRVGILPHLARRTRFRWPRAIRLRAIGSYVELAGDDEIPQLRRLLSDRNEFVRSHAAHGLGRLGDVRSIPLILDLCTRVKAWEIARLADALALCGRDAVPAICRWILANWHRSTGGEQAVAHAARVLGLIGDIEAETTLIELLESERLTWRVAAASALGRIASDTSRSALLSALQDDSWEVRARAVRALGNLADGSVAPVVSELLSDQQWWVRQNAAETLGELPGGVAELTKALESDDRFAADAARNQLAELRLLPAGISPALSGERQ